MWHLSITMSKILPKKIPRSKLGEGGRTYRGLNSAFASSSFKWIKLGNNKIIFRPSSMMGEWQKLQRTLQGSLCSMDFSVGSYHSRLWWPFEKLMSSLWKMAAHWKGAAAIGLLALDSHVHSKCEQAEQFEDRRYEGEGRKLGKEREETKHTMLRLTRRAMAQLAIQRLLPANLILDLPAMAIGLIQRIELLVVLVDAIRRALLPRRDARCALAAALVLVHSC
jgi:hypothetical protein